MSHYAYPSHDWTKAASVLLFLAVLILAPVGCNRREPVATQPEATMDELNSAASAWLMAKGTLPQEVSELTNYPSLKTKRLPTPPPGKKLAIDTVTRRVVMVDD